LCKNIVVLWSWLGFRHCKNIVVLLSWLGLGHSKSIVVLLSWLDLGHSKSIVVLLSWLGLGHCEIVIVLFSWLGLGHCEIIIFLRLLRVNLLLLGRLLLSWSIETERIIGVVYLLLLCCCDSDFLISQREQILELLHVVFILMHLVLFYVFSHVKIILFPALTRGALSLKCVLAETHVVLLS
jgi:hypothetical protein